MNKIALGLAALTLFAAPAMAQAPLNFADVDTDLSGELSLAELQAVWPDLTAEAFAAADIDGNGSLSADELNGLQPATLSAPMAVEPMSVEPMSLDGAVPAPAPVTDSNKSLLNTND